MSKSIIFIVLILSIFVGMIFIKLIPEIIRRLNMGIFRTMAVSWSRSRSRLRNLLKIMFSIERLVINMIPTLNKTTRTRKTTSTTAYST